MITICTFHWNLENIENIFEALRCIVLRGGTETVISHDRWCIQINFHYGKFVFEV